jgi:hypothetical protein
VIGAAAPENIVSDCLLDVPVDPDRAWLCGWACGTAGRIDLAGELSERWSTGALEPDVLVTHFEGGASRGLERRRGEASELELDPDSLLSSSSVPEPWNDVRAVRRERPSDGLLASWELETVPAGLSGVARAVRVSAASHWLTEAGDPCIRSARIGESSIELVFEDPAYQGFSDLSLELLHSAAARRTFPFWGIVHLEVAVDGERLGVLSVTKQGYHVGSISLPVGRLGPGEHTVRLSLGRSTTTTYRLVHAALRPTEETQRALDRSRR